MTDECITPLRQRMIEDLSLRNFGEKTQKDYIRAVKNLTIFRHRSPERIGNPKACIRGAERSHPVPMGLEGMIIAAGDADYVPAVARAQSKGWKVEVWFWSNAAEQLRTAASRFCALDKYLEYLRLGGGVALPP